MAANLSQLTPKGVSAGLGRLVIPVVVVVVIAGIAANSFYTVPQTDVAFVTRFGQVIGRDAGPVGPGLHFKLPFIDVADRLSTTTDTFELPERKAYTSDTQEVTLNIGITYRVPPAAAYHLLYEIGQAGSVDIHSNVMKLSNEVVREVISKHTANEIAGVDREKVVGEIKTGLTGVLDSILKLEISAVQLNALEFSPQYREAINQATLARTKSLTAQQDATRAEIEAKTRVTQARAEADARAAQAEGEARANLARANADATGNLARAKAEAEGNLLKAQADAKGIQLKGEAEAIATKAKLEAAGGADGYVRLLEAQAKLNWKGDVPQVMLGGQDGPGVAQMPIILPLTPAVKK
ncbi:MAG: prohibitin family protein [Ancalomicrobiaceae bacterium]|nr:prohibitin family protein [Ancalomicrobiaceae bacterium]